MLRTHDAGTLRADHSGQTVTLSGWVARRRDHGGVAFLDLRDASGVAQVVARDEVLTGAAHDLRNEYVITVVVETEVQLRRRAMAGELTENFDDVFGEQVDDRIDYALTRTKGIWSRERTPVTTVTRARERERREDADER